MESDERRLRMQRMRKQVSEFNVYRWAATFLKELSETRPVTEHSREFTLHSTKT
jgi:trehalose-6-phosphate synthase